VTLQAWQQKPSSLPRWRRRQRQRYALYGALCSLSLPFGLLLLLWCGVDLFGTIRVGGVPVARTRAGVSVLSDHAKRWMGGTVTVHVGPYVSRFTRERLGASLPVEPMQSGVLSLGRTFNPITDLVDFWTSRRGGLDVPWHAEIARETLAQRIGELRSRLERPPVPGALLPNGAELPGTPGLSVNLMGAIERLSRALSTGANEVSLDVIRIAAPRPVRYAGGHYDSGQFGWVLHEYSTKYRTGSRLAGRIRNIELAVQAIDRAVIEPGGQLSFNQTVGQRSYERGFETANEISNRRIVKGVGGGVCQVAATLHAAAFFSGLSLPEYHPHSRPAKYIEPGLDAMVAWPNQDMVIANAYPFPVRVRAAAADGVITIRLEGAGKVHPVDWGKEVLARTRASVQYVEDPSLGPGETQVLQEAIDGVTLRRRRVVQFPTGPQVDELTIRYPPNDRIVAVSPGSGIAGSTRVSASALKALDLDDF
jgi:vancomycin resistance protein YoaR